VGVLAGSFGALREREFRLLWVGQLLSNAGSSLLPVALAFAVLELGSAHDLGFAYAALIVPNLVLTLIGGVWADRLPRQRVMLVSDIVRGSAQTVMAMLLVGGQAELWHLFLLTAVYGSANAFFVPAANGLVPEVVSAERLQQANALMSLSRRFTNVGGPVVSGAVVAWLGPGWVYGLDGMTFFFSAVFLSAVRPTIRAVVRERFVAELVSGWREVRSRTWVWASILYFSMWNLAFTPFYVLGPYIVKRDLGGPSRWGLILAMTALGYIAGGVISLRLRPSRPLFIGYLLIAIYALPLEFLAYGFPAVVIGLGAMAGGATLEIANTLWYTTLQRRVPQKTLSRVLSYDALGSLIFAPIAYVIAAPIASVIGERATLLGAGSLLWISAVLVAAVPSIRQLRDDEGVPTVLGEAASMPGPQPAASAAGESRAQARRGRLP
jgi:MFS family permease